MRSITIPRATCSLATPGLLILALAILSGCAVLRSTPPTLEGWDQVAEDRVWAQLDYNMPDTEAERLIWSARGIRDLQAAESVYHRALDLLTAPHEQKHRWSVLLMLGNAAWWQGKKDEGEAWMSEAYRIAISYHPPDSIAVVATRRALALYAFDQGHRAKALELVLEAEEAMKLSKFSGQQALTDAITIGRLLVALKVWQRGETLLIKVRQARGVNELPPAERALMLGSLGRAMLDRDDTEQAISHFEGAVREWDAYPWLPPTASRVKAETETILGHLYLRRNQLRNAKLSYEHAAQSFALLQAPAESAVANSGLGDIFIKQSKYEQAQALLAHSYVVLKTPPHPSLPHTAALYAQTLSVLGERAAAEQVLQETLDLHKRGHISSEDASYFANELSTLQAYAGRYCEAQATKVESQALLARARPNEEWTEEQLRPHLMVNGEVACPAVIATQ